MISLSRNARDEYAQHVPELFWFLMLVTGFSTMVVKMRVSLLTASFFAFAMAGATESAATAIMMSFLIFKYLN